MPDYADLLNRVKHREASADHLNVVPRSKHNISRKSISDSALKVLYRLHKSGHRACLVGGGVRDLLLGIHPKDFDVATDATPEEVREVFTHMCGYAGFPRALDAMHIANEVLEEMGCGPKDGKLAPAARLSDAERWKLGAEGLSAVTGRPIPPTRPADDGRGPAGLGPLGGIAVDFCFGEIWSRTQLKRRDRSVLVCSILGALGRTDELKIHVPAALRNGVTRDELEELIVTLAAYAGFPFAVEFRAVLMEHLKKD